MEPFAGYSTMLCTAFTDVSVYGAVESGKSTLFHLESG
ncbi:MAG: hypothetical protein JWR67_1728 [Mucilaginibacter sp.]|jgi:hypothetical protein|nr:hypothetical protein [Mucilaginibacter sp.]